VPKRVEALLGDSCANRHVAEMLQKTKAAPIQMEFPELRKRYWGRRFWARGYFSTTSGNVTDDIINQYLELYSSR